jgi:hypothetical protein
MATTQSEYLLQKYFSSRLPIVHTLYHVGQAVGEMVMPVLIGSLLTKFGLSSTLLLQAGITLQALIGAVLFRKPQYRQTAQKNTAYTLLQVSILCAQNWITIHDIAFSLTKFMLLTNHSQQPT